MVSSKNNNNNNNKGPSSKKNNEEQNIRVAFCGNSILYYNDCPRLLEQMLRTKFVTKVQQDSCLRGGVTLTTLWERGNGMRKLFGRHPNSISRDKKGNTTRDKDGNTIRDIGSPTILDLLSTNGDTDTTNYWDYVIMNDHTQHPARSDTLEETTNVLKDHYGPLFLHQNKKSACIPVFLQTTAYRKRGVKESEDLGDVVTFTSKVKEGCESYVQTMLDKGIPNVYLAPVGDAFLWMHDNNKELWYKLFDEDDFHPSPYGTWLQACVLYCTILHKPPPSYQSVWYQKSRFMAKISTLPTETEAEELRLTACLVCNVNSCNKKKRKER
mmetsp:Transcript_12785/g.14630  ORF Transcript_12785/g.14630 Transcript_12785/m.14630 type:complete len:326 (-) Transcript_12785:17-994(-)